MDDNIGHDTKQVKQKVLQFFQICVVYCILHCNVSNVFFLCQDCVLSLLSCANNKDDRHRVKTAQVQVKAANTGHQE